MPSSRDNMFSLFRTECMACFTRCLILVTIASLATAAHYNDTNITATTDTKIPIYLGGFFAFGGWDTSGILPAVEMAIEHVNERQDILADYELRLVWNDTQCDSQLAIQSLFDQLFYKPQKTLIIGPGCSITTQEVAQVADYWNLVTMSYSASSPALSDKEKYPLFYRTCPTDNGFNPARIELIRHFNWSRVALIYATHDLFTLTVQNLRELLKAANITVISSETVAEDPAHQIENLKELDARIIIGNMYESTARKVFCEAYRHNITGEGYAWILLGWYSRGWYLADDEKISCSREEMRSAVEGSLYVSTEFITQSTIDGPGISGMTPQELDSAILARLLLPEYSRCVYHPEAPYGYDTVWALALMLNQSVEDLKTYTFEDGTRRHLEDFNYGDREMAQVFYRLLGQTNFTGFSGLIQLSGGDRVGTARIEQLQPSKCSDENEHLLGSWCLNFTYSPKSWEDAKGYCAREVGVDAVLAPIYDYDDLMEVESKIEDRYHDWYSTPWYLGLYITASGQLNTTTNDALVWDDLNINASFVSNITDGCIVVHFDPVIKMSIVNCSEEHPFICAEPEFAERVIGMYDPYYNTLNLDGSFIWPGNGMVPLDRSPRILTLVGKPIVIFATIIGIACVCICIAFVFLGFNIMYRDQKFVRLSSPNLNNLIILGCVMAYAGVILSALDHHTVGEDALSFLCRQMVLVWVLSLGVITAFGALLAKTWRVYQIAAFKVPKRKVIHDWQLFLIVLVLVLIDVILLLVWQIIDPPYLEERITDEEEYPKYTLVNYELVCTSQNSQIRLISILGYKGLLLIYGAFIAWETRKITIPALNDSKIISVCVLATVFSGVVGTGVYFSLPAYSPSLFIFVSSIILFCASLLLGLIFVPKIITVYKDPAGEHALGKNQVQASPRKIKNGSPGDNTNTEYVKNMADKIVELEEEVKELRTNQQRADYNAPKTCRLRCCGLICGCSCFGTCIKSGDDGVNESAAGYIVNDGTCGEGTSNAVYTGEQRIFTKADTTSSKSRKRTSKGRFSMSDSSSTLAVSAITEYCDELELPPPSHNDLSRL